MLADLPNVADADVGERLGGGGVEHELRAFGDPHAAGDRQPPRRPAEVLGINAFEFDGDEFGPIDDLEMQVADAVVAADDVERHVAVTSLNS